MAFLDDMETEVSNDKVLEGADKKQLHRVGLLGQEQLDLEEEIIEIEKELKDRKKELFLLTSSTIPELMKEIGPQNTGTVTGIPTMVVLIFMLIKLTPKPVIFAVNAIRKICKDSLPALPGKNIFVSPFNTSETFKSFSAWSLTISGATSPN